MQRANNRVSACLCNKLAISGKVLGLYKVVGLGLEVVLGGEGGEEERKGLIGGEGEENLCCSAMGTDQRKKDGMVVVLEKMGEGE